MASLLPSAAAKPLCYPTTTAGAAAATTRSRFWFATNGASLPLISGGVDRANWVCKLESLCRVRVAEHRLTVSARLQLAH